MNPNTITLAHIGGELVVLAGISFYFQRKISNLQDQVMHLTKDNQGLKSNVDDLNDAVQQLGQMVLQLQQAVFNKTLPPQQSQLPPLKRKSSRKQYNMAKKYPEYPQKTMIPQESESEMIGESEVERVVSAELTTLGKAEKDECSDGVCKLPQ